MDDDLMAVGERIRSRMPADLNQRSLAERAGMKPDALSRALNGQRGFSSRELARIADEIGADLYWLVTGERDPQRVRIAARHVWDGDRGVRTNPGRSHDEALLAQVVETYNAAFPQGPPPSERMPDSPEAMRGVLGENFARRFGDAVEKRLGVDVIRLPMLSTDYSLTIGSRAVVILATTPNWFRSNWSLSHELAHLALGHPSGDQHPGESDEAPADDFAARLLLPEALVTQQSWPVMSARSVARFLWETGVSTAALKNRLATLRIHPSVEVVAALKQATPVAVRAHTADEFEPFEVRRAVILRQQESSTRAVPSILLDALQQRVEDGAISPEHLAWALDVSVDEIDFPEPDDNRDLARAYEQGFDNRPSHAELADWLAARGRPAQ
ncbi:DNA-binding protein [Nocardia mangyaensis]|uniref:DNA-binding protein n=1 Tax=Nocardia mangyaensis TaxID=2213200 RepID=A0A1J0VPK0_9NOCA|nr:XRE family transcriptional regulator [Nocardia mangyaensis]APE33964.1 DNA-binding protein [Nocardia mangyaensis]